VIPGVGEVCFWWWGVNVCVYLWMVWLRGCVVSFRPVSASSLRLLLVF